MSFWFSFCIKAGMITMLNKKRIRRIKKKKRKKKKKRMFDLLGLTEQV